MGKLKHPYSVFILPRHKKWGSHSRLRSAPQNNPRTRGQQLVNQDQAASDPVIQFKGCVAPTKPQSSSPMLPKL